MKIAISTISKNEIHNVESFIESCVGADLISVFDTGSTDGTIELLKSHSALAGSEESPKPFDFARARNLALECLPEDIDVVISIDMDERLMPGWRESIEEAWTEEIDSLSYWYVSEWADVERTIPAIEGWRSKIFSPKRVKWFRPIHELPLLKNGESPKMKTCSGVIVHHYQEGSRDYSGQLTAYMVTHPEDSDAYIQRAAEYQKLKENRKAIADYETFLDLTKKTDCENKECDACQLLAGKRARAWIEIADAKNRMGVKPIEIIQCFLHATAECPNMRETWMHLADGWMSIGDYPSAYGAAMRALAITDNGINVKDNRCWGELGRQIASTSLTKIIERVNNSKQ
jgi:tetratricopeptide (TPR) repeat protein